MILNDEQLTNLRLSPRREVHDLLDNIADLKRQLDALKNEELGKKFTYCAYCGHTESVDTDGEIIAQHIRTCEKHPLNIEIARLKAERDAYVQEKVAEALLDFTISALDYFSKKSTTGQQGERGIYSRTYQKFGEFVNSEYPKISANHNKVKT